MTVVSMSEILNVMTIKPIRVIIIIIVVIIIITTTSTIVDM